MSRRKKMEKKTVYRLLLSGIWPPSLY
jgi:hypothetical protein